MLRCSGFCASARAAPHSYSLLGAFRPSRTKEKKKYRVAPASWASDRPGFPILAREIDYGRTPCDRYRMVTVTLCSAFEATGAV